MIYTILDIFGENNLDQKLKEELEGIQGWNEYFAYWAADNLMRHINVDEISNFATTNDLASEAVHKIINQGEIEYPDVLLQAFQSINLEKQVTLLRGCISLFLSTSQYNISGGYTGNLKSLKINRNKFPLLIYSHCLSGNYKQAEVLLKLQEKQDMNTDFAFTIYANFLFKKHKGNYLIDSQLSEKQKRIIWNMLENDKNILKYFIAPKFENKEK